MTMTDIHDELTAAKISDKVQELIYMLDLIDLVFATVGIDNSIGALS